MTTAPSRSAPTSATTSRAPACCRRPSASSPTRSPQPRPRDASSRGRGEQWSYWRAPMLASISKRTSMLRRDARIEVAAVVLACLAIWVLRRPQQITSPYVWVEESFVLRNLVAHGWKAIVEPLQGYVVLPASLLITIAAEISWIHLPALMSL